MPTIKSFAPSWLNKPAPAAQLFESTKLEGSDKLSAHGVQKSSKPGARRTIARRGAEVFVAVGREIRWGDLVYLKDLSEAKIQGRGMRLKHDETGSFEIYEDEDAQNQRGPAPGYRVIKTPVADDIRQLVISPREDYLAVITTHTVHLCALPDSSHLTSPDTAPYKAKFHTLGPTTHVTSKSAVVSALWHPLGVNGTALVTVTEDAVVRVWELSATDRWSYDSPTLSIDLKKLADGTSLDQDFSASATATNKAFSPDSFDMEVASASFAGRGSGGWSPMTLWVAMRGGDVYALCPLLPQRWAPPPTLIPSLSVSIVSKVAAIEDDPEISPQAKRLAQQQLDWMSDLDNQDPKLVEGPLGDGYADVYTRPARPGAVPRLQGPFTLEMDIDAEEDVDTELTDIYAIGEKIDTSELMLGEDDELEVEGVDQGGLSLSVICLLCTSGQIKVCIDLEGVEAQWLPPRTKSKAHLLLEESEPPSLLTIQCLDVLKASEVTEDGWPMFSEDVTSRYSFFVTHSSSITQVSLAPWVFRLESELQPEAEAGSDFRLGLLVKEQNSSRQRLFTQDKTQPPLSACVAIRDPDLGYLVLSSTQDKPVALVLEAPEDSEAIPFRAPSPSPFPQEEVSAEPPTMWDPRPLFQPSGDLSGAIVTPRWVEQERSGKRKVLMNQEVRLSAATLNIFSEAHRVVSTDVHRLNEAVAELFRKCEALQDELREQVNKANEVRRRVDGITGYDMEDDEPVSDETDVKNRLATAQTRQGDLASRMEALKKRMHRATHRELSDKERAWAEEVRTLEASISGSEPEQVSSPSKGKQPWKRLEEITQLRDELLAQAERLQASSGSNKREQSPAPPTAAPHVKIPADIRKQKVAQAISLLDRQGQLVEAIHDRLERLKSA